MDEDKLSLKNMLFTKAMPNLTIPFPTKGYKIFPCTDCGDKFIFQSSYDIHIKRKSLKITYMCRHCGENRVFFNRCNLLAHIRSHVFKTATINVTDLQIEPLPLNPTDIITIVKDTNKMPAEKNKKQKTKIICFYCKKDISFTGVIYKDRAKHFMQCTTPNILCYTCPVCLFSLPTICGLKAHLRIHLKMLPIVCPECGMDLEKNTYNYPYNHHCEGFNMIRATTRLKCFDNKCIIFHPSKFWEHMTSHIRKVYKCPICSFKWMDEPPKNKHTLCNNGEGNIICYFKCPICANRLLTKSQLKKHLNHHFETSCGNELKMQVYPCRGCGNIYKDVKTLIYHQIKTHNVNKEILEDLLKFPEENPKGIYKIIKRCEKCKRNFTYRCLFEYINLLPNKCPLNCSFIEKDNETNEQSKIICFMCKNKIDSNWVDIKKHFAKFHNTINCVDVKIELNKIDLASHISKNGIAKKKTGKIKKNIKNKKRTKISDAFPSTVKNDTYVTVNETEIIPAKDKNDVYSDLVPTSSYEPTDKVVCNKCGLVFQNKELLETHIISHRDPCTAYQCLECGQCFVVKPSFATHLLLEHGIVNVQEYIDKKDCFNKLALDKSHKQHDEVEEPVQENQCKICRERFQDAEALEKHFRVHGMAFLMKNKQLEKS